MATRHMFPRLRDIKIGFNQVTVVHKDPEGWWNVRLPRALYPIRYSTWECAINFAHDAGLIYMKAEPEQVPTEDIPAMSRIMINRDNV